MVRGAEEGLYMPLSSVTEALRSHCSGRNTREESGHPPCVHGVAEAERGTDGSRVTEGGADWHFQLWAPP